MNATHAETTTKNNTNSSSIKDHSLHFICEADDVSSFDPHAGIGVGESAVCAITLSDGVSTRNCLSMEDFQIVCARTLECVGYTTRFVSVNGLPRTSPDAVFVEQPVLLHYRTPGFTPWSNVTAAQLHGLHPTSGTLDAMMYYAKSLPANRTCRYEVQERGDMSIYLQQSFFKSSFAQIFVTDPVLQRRRQVKECGDVATFAAVDAATGQQTFGADGEVRILWCD